MIRVGIAGASGYTGLELIRLLSRHPQVSISRLYSKSQIGVSIASIYPHLSGIIDIILEELTAQSLTGIDVLFLALPHGQSQQYVETIFSSGVRTIDLSADFRLNSPSIYKTYYNDDHIKPELLGQIPLGLPELFRTKIINAPYVSCPGCYATSVMVGLAPLSRTGRLNEMVIVDSKSGVSGAGRTVKESNLYCEVNESFTAYSTGTHRHTAEMEMVLGSRILFSPHLVPMSRGILSTMYVDAALSVREFQDLYTDFYRSEPFVTILTGNGIPSTKMVTGTNSVFIGYTPLPKYGKTVIYSALDNLIKGASGQGIQCMNVMFGFEEDAGLPKVAHYF
ncbi:N-acetyl-gamma-glutamyl-phosphate reductase [bacterium]|nr:N-acetyl-gamma-glutamyl-phosphate reductase [bacterium]